MRLVRAELGPERGRLDAVDLAAWVVVLALTPVAAVAAAAVAQASRAVAPSVAFVVTAAAWPLLGRAARLELSWTGQGVSLARRLGPIRWTHRAVARTDWTIGLHAALGVTSLVLFGARWNGAPLTVISSAFHRVPEGQVRAWADAAQPVPVVQQVAAQRAFP